jgi:hypothetical protein
MVDSKECTCIKFCFKLSNTTSEIWQVNQGLTVMTQKLIAELYLKSPFSPHPTKARHIRLNIKRTRVTFFDCESTVVQEFIPTSQTIKPALLLCGFATFEEGFPPKLYGITIA